MNEVEMVRVNKTLTIDDAAAFHGHKGPFLIIGYRAGMLAVEMLKPETEFDLEVEAHIPFRTPYSCILDGLQCATKCTLGKGNIRCFDSEEFILKIRDRRNSRAVKLRLKTKSLKSFLEEPIDVAARAAERLDIKEILEILQE